MVQQQGELQATGVFSSCIDILIARQKETGTLKAVIRQVLISRKWIGGTISVHVMIFLRSRLRSKGNHHHQLCIPNIIKCIGVPIPPVSILTVRSAGIDISAL
jgi:hypothetical protein